MISCSVQHPGVICTHTYPDLVTSALPQHPQVIGAPKLPTSPFEWHLSNSLIHVSAPRCFLREEAGCYGLNCVPRSRSLYWSLPSLRGWLHFGTRPLKGWVSYMRPLGWALIQSEGFSYQKQQFGHMGIPHGHTEDRRREDTVRKSFASHEGGQPVLPTSCPRTDTLQSWAKMRFCCLSHPVWGVLLWQHSRRIH